MQLNVQRDSSLPTIRGDSDITYKLNVFMTHLHVTAHGKINGAFCSFPLLNHLLDLRERSSYLSVH